MIEGALNLGFRELLPAIAVVSAFTINYSIQPPRSMQLKAGASLAIAGFIVTFAVLGVLTVIIKVVAALGARVEAKKKAAGVVAVAKPAVETVPAAPTVSIAPAAEEVEAEIAAAAVAAVQAYLREKEAARAGAPEKVDAWVIGERVSPPGSQFYDELTLRESMRWRRR